MTGGAGGTDADRLIERLQARAADPDRRTEVRPSVFEAGMASLSLGGMLSLGGSIAGALRRVVASNQAGRMPDADVLATAQGIERDMTTPAPSGDLRPATPDSVAAAARELDVAFPPLLSRLYVDVADGGFGPGTGLLSLEKLVRETRELRRGDVLPRNRSWPATLLPLVERDPGWFCVDVASGAVVEWDPEDLVERSSEERFRRSFLEVTPSLEAWLERWLRRMDARERKPSEEERWARMAARAQTPKGQAHQLAQTRRHMAQLSPEDRKQWGLADLYPDIEAELQREEAERRGESGS